MNKYFIFISVLLFGCTSVSNLYYSRIEMDSDSGEYQSFRLDTWNAEDSDCFVINVKKPNLGTTKWGSIASLALLNEDESKSLYLSLMTDRMNSETLGLYLRKNIDGKKTKQMLARNIAYGESVKVKFSYPSDTTISLEVVSKSLDVNLGFTPVDFQISSSSSVATFISAKPEFCD